MRIARLLLCALALAGTSGCAGSIERWIVNTRVNQGDVALQRGSLHEAQTAYQLALRVDPKDVRARAGFSQVSLQVAEADYRRGDFDDALATLDAAAKYDPSSMRLAALRSTIDQAKLKREIVISNYPTYQAAGEDIRRAYSTLDLQSKSVLRSLGRFDYTYDTQDLTKAINDSYELELEVAKNTNRLIAYRQLVESGVPEASRAAHPATTGSLLPLP